jgi:hypothetical protein
MNTSRALSVLLLLLAATFPSVADSVELPDYRKDAKKVHLRECDSSTTHVTMYRSATYYVTEAITDSGESFIMMYSNRGEAHFLMKAAGLPDRTEVSREKWYEGIEAVAPNYFRHIRGIPKSDCYLAEEYY